MSGKATTGFKFRQYINQIVFIPAFIGIAKKKVKGTFKLLYKFMGISKPGINKFGKSCFLKVR